MRTPSGVYRAKVTRVKANGKIFVEVRRLAKGFEYGPLDILEGFAGVEGSTDTVAVGDHGSHAHVIEDPPPLQPGDRVLVAFVEGRPDDPVILGRLV